MLLSVSLARGPQNRDLLDVSTVGLLDLAIDVSDRHGPRPKGIGI
jgi:hypothetical protein